MVAGGGLNELGINSYLIVGLSDAPFQYVSYAKFLPDLLYLYGLPFVCERGTPGDDKEIGDFGKIGNQVFCHPVGEIFLFRVTAHVDKREYSDRRFIRERKGHLRHRGDIFGKGRAQVKSPEQNPSSAKNQNDHQGQSCPLPSSYSGHRRFPFFGGGSPGPHPNPIYPYGLHNILDRVLSHIFVPQGQLILDMLIHGP